MSSYKAVKVALDPSPAQERLLLSHAGAARFAFNAGLAHVKAGIEAGEKLDWSYKALSRKVKGSRRRAKARAKVARIHARVANQRHDAMHKLTTWLASTFSHISVEDLNTAGMARNHRLAKAVSDASFGEFRRQLEYKTAKTGARLHVIDRWYPSSKTCSKCGAVKAKLSLAERTYKCDGCGLAMDRDLNAAVNILVAGSAPETINARGGDTSRADTTSGNANPTETRTKQPPTSGVRLGAGLGNETMRF